jgi:hypothetical protein
VRSLHSRYQGQRVSRMQPRKDRGTQRQAISQVEAVRTAAGAVAWRRQDGNFCSGRQVNE